MNNDTILVLNNPMVQYVERYKKNIAIDMRKRGMSYSEIENRLHVARSTLSWWLKKVPLTEEQVRQLRQKRSDTLRANSEKKKKKTLEAIEQIKNDSSKNIQNISKRELWLMGIILCWRERLLLEKSHDLYRGLRFSSADPYLVKLFLKWLQEIGGISDEEILFDLFLEEKKKKELDQIIEYWWDVTGFPKTLFSRVYFRKNSKVRRKREIVKTTQYGFLRIRVKASSLLARQVAGWIRGIQQYYWQEK